MIGYDRLLLKDCHVLVVHNFIETGNSHEHKCNRHFRKLLARLRDIHSKDSCHSCTTEITSYTEVLTLDTLAGSQFQFIFTTELLGMVFACHEGTIGYDRLLLKDRHVLVVHNFTETGNSHEHKCNKHFRKLLARLRDTHWGTLMLSLGLLLSCKSPDSDQRHQRNKTTWNSMESNQSWINKQTFSTLTWPFYKQDPQMDLSKPATKLSVHPQSAPEKNAKPAPLERFPHETQWCDSLWFQLFWADLTLTTTRFRSPLLKY